MDNTLYPKYIHPKNSRCAYEIDNENYFVFANDMGKREDLDDIEKSNVIFCTDKETLIGFGFPLQEEQNENK